MVTQVPAVLLRHRITVEPYAGEGAYGPQYRHAIPNVRALVDDARAWCAPPMVGRSRQRRP
ncbi:hypothetical protein [Streptomyces noursei]|uniref:hypothetical protein n=1 Tax=Streptomyces noursei TaxID=1971 RepID=UPI001F0489A8|nr:hypothetical protein [Streptomyces noursei]